jgi:hypothetical protein
MDVSVSISKRAFFVTFFRPSKESNTSPGTEFSARARTIESGVSISTTFLSSISLAGQGNRHNDRAFAIASRQRWDLSVPFSSKAKEQHSSFKTHIPSSLNYQ